MKDERKKYILIGMFILFIGYYGMFIMFTKNLVSTEKEKRELNRMPSLSSENYENFTADFTAFFKDYIPFRQQLTEMHNNFMVNIVHTSSNDAVIIGKKGWLFYNSKAKDPETDEVVDYNGSIQYTKEQKERVATEVQAATEYCRENGSKMVFLMAPNKSSVYKQYMPDTYREVGDEKRCEELAEYLQKNTDAEVLYPKDELIEFSKKQKTYFSNDTHWNGMGGLM